MTPAAQQELYLLRRHMGISAHQALCELPAWELELLTAGLLAEHGDPPAAAAAPAALAHHSLGVAGAKPPLTLRT